MRSVIITVFCLGVLNANRPLRAEDAPTIPVAALDRTTAVDFRTEVLPILRQNCLACHNATKHESDLVLEDPATMLKGGLSGAAVEPGKGAESLLLLRATGEGGDLMPPKGNTAAARNLTSEELGLIKLWIDQGAKDSESSGSGGPQWQPLPPGMNSIYAVALSRDGQFAACGRANQIFVYHVPTGRFVGRLTDPALLNSGVYSQPGVAHLDVVNALALSPAGDWLASGGFQEVKLWQRPRNVIAQAMEMPAGARVFAVAPDCGRFAFAAATSPAIQIWNRNGTLEHTLAGHSEPVTSLAFTRDGAKLASGSADKTVRVWTVADGAALGQLNVPQPVAALAWIAGETQFAVGGGDNAICLWNVPVSAEPVTAEPAAVWEGHGQPVTCLTCANRDGSLVLSGSADGTMRLWQVGAGQQRQFDHGGPVAAVASRADGTRFASTGPNGVARLWNAADGNMVAELKGDLHADLFVKRQEREYNLARARQNDRQNELNAAQELVKSETEAQKKVAEELTKSQQARDEKVAAAKAAQEAQGAADKSAADATTALTKATEAKTAAEAALAQVQAAVQKSTEAVQAAEAALASAADIAELQAAKQAVDAALALAQQLAASAEQARGSAEQGVNGAQNRVNQTAEEAKNKAKAAEEAAAGLQGAETVVSAAMKSLEAADGSLAKANAGVPLAEQALAQSQEGVKAAEAAWESARQAANAKQLPLAALAFSPDGSLVIAGGADNVIHTWSAETGAPGETFTGHSGAILALAFAGPTQLASLAEGERKMFIWEIFPDWRLANTIAASAEGSAFVDRVLALDFSPDGALLATGGGEPSRGGELKVWNVADGVLVREIPDAHSDTVFCVRFSPDGKQIASCGADKFVKVFQIDDGQLVRSFEGHTHHVLGVAWRADGKVLASCSADNTIKVWDATNGDQLRTIGGFAKEVTSIEFVGEGTEVVASSGDQTVRLFNTADGNSPRSFGGGGDFMYAAAVAPDGALVLAGGQDSVLRLWNGTNAQEVRQFQPPAPQQ